MSKVILGIDVSKEKLDVCLQKDEQSLHAVFDNDGIGHRKLLRWLNKRTTGQKVHTCLEATGMYAFPVAEALHQSGVQVSLVNPARISAYAKSQLVRNKTDKLDAGLIADFCRTQTPPGWTPPGPEFNELQALVRLLEDLQNIKQAEVNRLKSGVRSKTVIESLERHIDYLDTEMEGLKKQINDHIDNHPKLKRQKDWLVSITGIGDLTACKLLGEVPDFLVFENTRQLDAFAGLNPKQRRSGKMKGRSPISKTGNAHLRRALYMPALVAMRHNPIVREFCHRLEANGKMPMEVVVAAMRKLLHLAYGVIKNDQPFNPSYQHERGSLYVFP